MRNKWLITLVGLTIAFAAITGGSFALAGEGTDAPDVGEPSGDGPVATSIDDIDPNECNWIHNITACNDTPVIGPDGEGVIKPDISRGEPSATSIDDIDPNECNWMHNRAACNDTPVTGPDGEGAIEPDISVGEPYPMPTADKPCVPMAVVTITSEGEVSCLDLAPDTGDDQGQVSPAGPPVAEPVR
ncbi:MAG: hypothetical protein IIC94_05140 [Chloroflexi bacterium]|nr:hypothetical protein [Chloroflexota bacterium]